MIPGEGTGVLIFSFLSRTHVFSVFMYGLVSLSFLLPLFFFFHPNLAFYFDSNKSSTKKNLRLFPTHHPIATTMVLPKVPHKGIALNVLPSVATFFSWLSFICLLQWIGSAKGRMIHVSNASKSAAAASAKDDKAEHPAKAHHAMWGYLALVNVLVAAICFGGDWYLKRAYITEYNDWVDTLPTETAYILHQIDATDARPSS